MEYEVKAEVVTGIRGKKYRKGSKVKDEFFYPGHAKQMEAKGSLDKIGKKTSTSSGSSSDNS